ncbi:hypothetical protein IGI37_001985 [Enterococcus sp. AZ194]|uniref:hypothetical protein n=1 Tax=Enterococcus sp. AZ194 TaxID=2774629 RepID=UPI003F27B8B5
MKHVTFSKFLEKNIFLAMTYFLVGVAASNFLNTQALIFAMGIYVTVSAIYINSLRYRVKKDDKKATQPASIKSQK